MRWLALTSYVCHSVLACSMLLASTVRFIRARCVLELKKFEPALGARMPIQFLTGHSHLRAWTRLDAFATSFEAGHYGDTVGFAAVSTKGVQPLMSYTETDTLVEAEKLPLRANVRL